MSAGNQANDEGAYPKGDPPQVGGPLRQNFSAELEQLRLQTELMGVRVEQNLEMMREVLRTGDVALAARAVAADDEIDAMNVSLTERCYRLLAQETPVAGDLRLVVSVVRIISELERVGDLCLRVVKLAPDHDLLTADGRVFAALVAMADEAVDAFQAALRAWATLDVEAATQLATGPRAMDAAYEELTGAVVALTGDRAVPVALAVVVVARALERIVDHAGIVGSRIRYLITGDPGHLAAEVR
jgi:phosphate transport system protein